MQKTAVNNFTVRRGMHRRGMAVAFLSVRLSVKHMLCDKTK